MIKMVSLNLQNSKIDIYFKGIIRNLIFHKEDSKHKLTNDNVLIKMNSTIESHGIKNYYIKTSMRKNTPPSQLISTKGFGKSKQSINSPNSSFGLKTSSVKVLPSGASFAITRPEAGSEIIKPGTMTMINRPIMSTSQIGENFVVQSGKLKKPTVIGIREISIQNLVSINEGVMINPIFNMNQKNSKSMNKTQTNETLFWKNQNSIVKSTKSELSYY